jgi:hypothetical protein
MAVVTALLVSMELTAEMLINVKSTTEVAKTALPACPPEV